MRTADVNPGSEQGLKETLTSYPYRSILKLLSLTHSTKLQQCHHWM